MNCETEAISSKTARAVRAEYRRAVILACILSGLLTVVSVLFPPILKYYPGMGMQEWRTLAQGGSANSVVAPDPADISRDRTKFTAWWSPGQYLIPGVLTTFGLRLGTALSITAGLSLLCCLLGWIRVFRHFAFSDQAATFGVACLSTFRYSTLPFGNYNGGEILLQGITPWLILAACRVPVASALRAAGLAGLAMLIGFFAKLTGVLVACAALTAGSIAALRRLRRITTGMVAGAVGTIFALGLLEAVWFSRGATPASGAGWPFQFSNVIFAAGAPLGAGVSWGDMLESILFHPGWPRLPDQFPFVWFFLPMVVFEYGIVWDSRMRANRMGAPGGSEVTQAERSEVTQAERSEVTQAERSEVTQAERSEVTQAERSEVTQAKLSELIAITACVYAICALTIGVLYMRRAAISLDERHFRSAGTLIFVCVLGVADRLQRGSAVRFAVFAFCSLMSLYGVLSFVNRVRSAKPGDVDSYDRTRQVDIDLRAVEYARAAFARQQRSALFVIPTSTSLRVSSHSVRGF